MEGAKGTLPNAGLVGEGHKGEGVGRRNSDGRRRRRWWWFLLEKGKKEKRRREKDNEVSVTMCDNITLYLSHHHLTK